MPSIAPGAVKAFEEADDSTTLMKDSPTSELSRGKDDLAELKATTASQTTILLHLT